MTILTFPRHKLFSCRGECDYSGTCMFCEGGLALCVVCHGAEGSLPSECPGYQMTYEQEEDVYNGILDYRKGEWIHVNNKIISQK